MHRYGGNAVLQDAHACISLAIVRAVASPASLQLRPGGGRAGWPGRFRARRESGPQIARPGWKERVQYAEIFRIKRWMLSLRGDLEGAEPSYLASLD
jgi:hypothetical protein